MDLVINSKTVVLALLLAAVGIVFNTTRTTLSGIELYLWIGATIVIAVLLAIGIQSVRGRPAP